jgi:serine/threonine protein phosphatase 1
MTAMTKKRQIAIGDIHGCYDLLKELVEYRIKFDPLTDELIFLGDYIDRGKDSKRVVEYVGNLQETYPDRVVLLKGNHELLAYRAFLTNLKNDLFLWEMEGSQYTIESFGGFERARVILMPFIRSLRIYYQTADFIFVHGGIPSGETIETASEEELLWERDIESYTGKTIVVGHTPRFHVTRFAHAIAIDTGAFHYSKLSAYDVLNATIYSAIMTVS